MTRQCKTKQTKTTQDNDILYIVQYNTTQTIIQYKHRIQSNPIQHNATQYKTRHYNTIQYTRQYKPVQHKTLHYTTLQYNTT